MCLTKQLLAFIGLENIALDQPCAVADSTSCTSAVDLTVNTCLQTSEIDRPWFAVQLSTRFSICTIKITSYSSQGKLFASYV